MARSIQKNNLHAKEILLLLARVGIIAVAATSPLFLSALIKQYFKHLSKEQETKRRKALRELEKRKYISFDQNKDGTVSIKLTHRGNIVVRRYRIEEMRIEKPKTWDKQWRVLLYDIPTRYKQASDAFREKLKQLGIYQLQKSVWVSPYDFIGEVEFLCGVFDIDINKHILYFATPQIPRENQLKKHFRLI
ncbi:hypothetical protein D4R51_01395 [bacterium]|nr:MAG: hypothetical protein D4R51_01395 [bacterium]